jgi:hypothetical protein
MLIIKTMHNRYMVEKRNMLWEFLPNREEGPYPFIFYSIYFAQRLLRSAQSHRN